MAFYNGIYASMILDVRFNNSIKQYNFYYCRSDTCLVLYITVYKANIISTIVDL